MLPGTLPLTVYIYNISEHLVDTTILTDICICIFLPSFFEVSIGPTGTGSEQLNRQLQVYISTKHTYRTRDGVRNI